MRPLPKDLYKVANQAAHRLALRHEAKVKDLLLARLEADSDAGATLTMLFQRLRQLEEEGRSGTL